MNLLEYLSHIPDFRRSQGRRYPLNVILGMCIMAIICGYQGCRETGIFCKVHKDEFVKWSGLKNNSVPSCVTIRGVLRNISFEELNKAFKNWSRQYIDIEEGGWISIDGKALGSTAESSQNNYQNFVSLAGLFPHKQKQVIEIAEYENKKTSETALAAELIINLDLKGVVLAMDARCCQKKQQRV